MDESIATLNRILGKSSQGTGSQDSGSEGSNINDLTNLFHFLLLDKVDVKIRDKLTKVYSIFRSTSPQSGPEPAPQPGAPQPPEPGPEPAPQPPQPPSEPEITYTPLEEKRKKAQSIDTDHTNLLKELNNKKHIGEKEKSLESNDPVGNLIDQIYNFSLYEKCIVDGNIIQYPYKLDYNAIHNTAYHAYSRVERDYFISWANDLKRWVDSLKPKT